MSVLLPLCKSLNILYDFGTEKLWIREERCTHCKEEIFGEQEHRRIYDARKRLCAWGENLKLHRKIERSGVS